MENSTLGDRTASAPVQKTSGVCTTLLPHDIVTSEEGFTTKLTLHDPLTPDACVVDHCGNMAGGSHDDDVTKVRRSSTGSTASGVYTSLVDGDIDRSEEQFTKLTLCSAADDNGGTTTDISQNCVENGARLCYSDTNTNSANHNSNDGYQYVNSSDQLS